MATAAGESAAGKRYAAARRERLDVVRVPRGVPRGDDVLEVKEWKEAKRTSSRWLSGKAAGRAGSSGLAREKAGEGLGGRKGGGCTGSVGQVKRQAKIGSTKDETSNQNEEDTPNACGAGNKGQDLLSEWAASRNELIFRSDEDDGCNTGGQTLNRTPKPATDEALGETSVAFERDNAESVEAVRREQEKELIDMNKLVDRYAMAERGPLRVMIFDEDDLEMEHSVNVFREMDFEVEATTEFEHAVSLFARKRSTFDVVVIGFRGPGYLTLRFLQNAAPIKVPIILTRSRESDPREGQQQQTQQDKEAGEMASEGWPPSASPRSLVSREESEETALSSERTAEKLAEASNLGVDLFVFKPLVAETLSERVDELMKRFGSAAREFKRMLQLSDPDFATKQAKELIIEEIANRKARRQSVAEGYVISAPTKKVGETKFTVDIAGTGKRRSKFALALKRSREASNAKKRVEKASLLRQLENRYTVKTVDPRRRGSRRRSSAVARPAKKSNVSMPGLLSSKEQPSSIVQKVLQSNGKAFRAATADSSKATGRAPDAKMALSVITSLAQKQTKSEGTLPLLMDFSGKLSYIKLPWEAERQARQKMELGRVPKLRASDILQSPFREQVPTSKCATSGQRFLLQGYECKIKGDLATAIRMYTKATVADQRNASAFLCRGVAYHLVGDDRSALEDFTECLDLDPKSTSARFNRALIFANEGRHGEAVRELDEAIAINPHDEELFHFRAFTRRRCGEFTRAQDDYKIKLNVLQRNEQKRAEEAQVNGGRGRKFTGLSSKDKVDKTLKALSSPGAALSSVTPKANAVDTKRLWDTNHDGRVDLAEFTAATQYSDSIHSNLFQGKSDLEVACDKPENLRTKEDLGRIFRATQEIELFRRMPHRFVRDMCRSIKLANVMPGEYVLQQGAPSHNFFAILEGNVSVTVELSDMDAEHVVHKMGQGEYFGENGLINDTERQVNILVPGDGESALIFVIPKATFLSLEIGKFVDTDRVKRRSTLRHCRIFNGMSDEDFHELCKIARPVEFHHNTVILRQGDPASRFCILVNGICKTLRYADPGADLIRKKHALQHRITQFDMSYAVHHANVQEEKTQLRIAKARQLHSQRVRELAQTEAKIRQMQEDASCPIKRSEHKVQASGTLYPGNIFGEEALLNPYYGREEYTVVADTFVIMLVIHKEQLQACKQSELLLEKVRNKKLQQQACERRT
ncbi:cGMP-dependent protein kinase [Durusdinium trenchii]|uniref:Isozyme 2 forms cD5/T2 (CGK) (Foraging protein) n=1 Tax=Durusdinium trenchii TaxID=1381693 RepID=A0ABP0HHP4_9DINO